MKRIHVLATMLMYFVLAGAQGVTWSVDVNTIFDNREGDDFYSGNGTIFLTRVSPEVGLTMMDGTHKIAVECRGFNHVEMLGKTIKQVR